MNRHSAARRGEKPAAKVPDRSGDHDEAAPEGKRERILEAAVRIFAVEGFYNAKVSQIAREAGVADGTIYLYFKSKDDLLISLFEDRMSQVNDNVRSAIATEGSPVDKLRRVVQLHLRLVEENPQLAEVLTVELRQSAKFLKEYRQTKFGEFLKLIAQPIEAGQADGSIRSDLDAPLIARALFGALDELALVWCLRSHGNGAKTGAAKNDKRDKRGPGVLDLPRVAEQLADLFIEGLGAGGERPARHTQETHSPVAAEHPAAAHKSKTRRRRGEET